MSSAQPEVMHIVLFRWKEEADPRNVAAAIEGLKALAERIPGILELTCGDNFSTRAQGYATGLVVRFVDRAALEAYGPHPAHQDVVQNRILPYCADIIAVDYEING